MQQYFAKDKELNLNDTDHHHIKNVMRMKKGDVIEIVYDNVRYVCELTEVANKCKYQVLEKEESNKNDINITLAFSLIKEQKQNYLMQKATEIGVSDLIPIETERTVVKIDKKKELNKIERWQRICKESAEQSFRYEVPKIHDIENIKNINVRDYDLKILLSLDKNAKNMKKVLQKNTKYDKIILIVGPEGGFSIEEENKLVEKGFIKTSLGTNVLRAETAPLVAISMINYELMR